MLSKCLPVSAFDKDDADDHGDDRGGLYVGLVVTCHGSVSTSTGVSASQLGIMEPKHVCHSSRFIFLLPMYRPRHKKQFKADVQPVGVKTQTTQKLREHQKEREALCAQLQTLEKRDLRLLSLANPDLDRRLTCVVVASEQAASSLKPLHMRVHLWQNTVQQFQELLRMCVVWFCDTDDLESAVMLGAHEDCFCVRHVHSSGGRLCCWTGVASSLCCKQTAPTSGREVETRGAQFE